MKILLDKEKSLKYPYVATILRGLESKFGEEVIVSNFEIVNDDVLLDVKSICDDKEYHLRITKLCYFDSRIGGSSRSIFILENSDYLEEYICDIGKYSYCRKENDIYCNGDITVIKWRPLIIKENNFAVYTLKKNEYEIKIITPYGDDVFKHLGNIKKIDLISVYHQLERINPIYVQNIVLESIDSQTNNHEVLTIENNQLKKYERDYINDNNVSVNLIYNENGVEVLTKQNILYDENNKIFFTDIASDIKKVKSLFK